MQGSLFKLIPHFPSLDLWQLLWMRTRPSWPQWLGPSCYSQVFLLKFKSWIKGIRFSELDMEVAVSFSMCTKKKEIQSRREKNKVMVERKAEMREKVQAGLSASFPTLTLFFMREFFFSYNKSHFLA